MFICICGSRERVREIVITQTGDIEILICARCGLVYDSEFYNRHIISMINETYEDSISSKERR